MKSLIVDDSRAMRRVLALVVQELGFEVLQAANADEALLVLQNNPDVELCLIDWNMPGISGVELIRKMRENVNFRKTRIVMVTSESEPIQIARAFMAGADEFVTKPFTPDRLREKLKLIGVVVK